MSNRPPKMGKLSTQLACARAKRCINGDEFELSGLNSFALARPVITRWARSTSMSTSSASAQATKIVKASIEVLKVLFQV